MNVAVARKRRRLAAIVLLVASCSKGGPPGTGPSRGTWAKFTAEGRSFAAPASWTVTDPVAGKASGSGWCRSLPATTISVARAASAGRATEALVMHGPSAELARYVDGCLSERRADLRIKFDESFRTTSAEGAEVTVQVGHLEPDVPGGSKTSLLLGQAVKGDHMLVVDAGGVAANFDRSGVMTLIGSVTF
jgi:hypothetical protein